jgi:hypothetical protein
MTNNDFHDTSQPEHEPTPEEADALARAEAKRAERMAKIALELERLKRLLAQYARFNKDNTPEHEWENVKRKLEEAKTRKEQLDAEYKVAMDGDKNLPMVRPTLASTMDEIVRELARFVVIEHDDALSIALWIVQTHVFMLEIFEHTPFLMVHSKEPDSGKSTVAEFIDELAQNARLTSSLTGSRLEAFLQLQARRKTDPDLIQYWQDNDLIGLGLTVLLFDEADQYKATGLLIRLINAAHRKRGTFWSAEGEDVPCFAPIAVFRVGDPRRFRELRAQVSRSILIEMKMRDPNNPDHDIDGWNEDNRRKLPVLKQQISFLVRELKPAFMRWRPEPNFLGNGNRRADNWRPLVAIGDVASGHWGETARRLAMKPLPEPEFRIDLPEHRSQRENDKARILAHLEEVGGRCSRTDLYAVVFQRNLPAHVLTDYLEDLRGEGKVRISKESRTEWIELEPTAQPTPPTPAPKTKPKPTEPTDAPTTREPDLNEKVAAAVRHERWCRTCQQFRKERLFGKTTSGNFLRQCKECRAAYDRERRKNRPRTPEEKERRRLKSRSPSAVAQRERRKVRKEEQARPAQES